MRYTILRASKVKSYYKLHIRDNKFKADFEVNSNKMKDIKKELRLFIKRNMRAIESGHFDYRIYKKREVK